MKILLLFTTALIALVLLANQQQGVLSSSVNVHSHHNSNNNKMKNGAPLRDAPTGGTIIISPSYFYKATQHLKSAFDTSVLNTFSAPALQGPLPSLNPCIINYDTLSLATFSESDITYTPIVTTTNSTTTAVHQIIIHNPVFTLKPFPYAASCVFASGVGQLNTEASGTIAGTWSVPNITVEVTETVSANTSSTQGAVVVTAATLKTDIELELTYTYDEQPVVGSQFIWDSFWNHHVKSTMQTTVRNNIASLFNQGGAPISILTGNMNAILAQWPQVCAIDQKTIPGALILNTHPLCKTVLVDGLPNDDFATVEVSVGAFSESDKKRFLTSSSSSVVVNAAGGDCQAGNCWLPSSFANQQVFVTYNNCTACSLQQGQITGTSGFVTFTAN